MKKTAFRIFSFLMAVLIVAGYSVPVIQASDDPAVQAVIEQLEAIDSLAQMQAKRYTFTASGHYDVNTTNETIISKHTAARTGYETYVSEMFAARVAAQQAYDALTDEQKAQIDPALVAKLTDTLSTSFDYTTRTVTPRDDDFSFEAVDVGVGGGYEVSNQMVAGNIPQTFVLVDTSNGATSWTPDGVYECGESNYEVAYCCDIETPIAASSHYKRENLEDSGYFGEYSAEHVRAILQNSYPYISMDQMKADLLAAGMDADFVTSLTRADIIAAVQMSVWVYANISLEEAMGYFASVSVTKNTGIYFTPLHDYSNELWDWFAGKRVRTYDARAQYRVNNLAYYLCNLPGAEAAEGTSIVSDVSVTRADLVPNADGTYKVGMYLHLNGDSKETDDIRATVICYQTNEDGTKTVTSNVSQAVGGRTSLQMTVKAKPGDTVEVVVEGEQDLDKGVYFYEPEGGRESSQSLVSVSYGRTNVRATESFTFEEDAGQMGLRIYKTETTTGLPISEILFDIYKAEPAEGQTLESKPTEEEIARYAVEENKVASLITDATGYADAALEEGTYLVVEQHNAEKVLAPVDPFYVTVPMLVEVTNEDGSVGLELLNIVSLYPKNEPTVPPTPPPPPPPEKVMGSFRILKYDESDSAKVLEGAQFQVYTAATEEDTDATVIKCNGAQCAVVPVMVDGAVLTLTTGADGTATTPELECGTYFLVETVAPAGYNLSEEAWSVTVVSNTLTTTTLVEITNQRGNILPETGGFGTTMIILAGAVLTLGAGIFIVTRKSGLRQL